MRKLTGLFLLTFLFTGCHYISDNALLGSWICVNDHYVDNSMWLIIKFDSDMVSIESNPGDVGFTPLINGRCYYYRTSGGYLYMDTPVHCEDLSPLGPGGDMKFRITYNGREQTLKEVREESDFTYANYVEPLEFIKL